MASLKRKSSLQQTAGEINRAYINDDDLTISISSFNSGTSAVEKFENVTTLLTLFRFASSTDLTLVTLGMLAAIGTGICAPFYTIYLSSISHEFITRGLEHTFIKTLLCRGDLGNQDTIDEVADYESMVKEISSHVIAIVIVSVVHFFMAIAFVACFNIAAANVVTRIKCFLFNAILRQEVAWHDLQIPSTFTSIDMKKVQEGTGEKFGCFVSGVASYLACILCALVYGWNFTLVMITLAPIMTLIVGWISRIQSSFSEKQQVALADCNSVAHEVFTLIKTVVAFDGQDVETTRFIQRVELATKAAIKRGFVTAAIAAIHHAFPFLLFAGGFCYATWHLEDVCVGEGYTVLDILIVFFCILSASMRIGSITPYLKNFSLACNSARSIFEVINNKPKIDSSSLKGLIPNKQLSGTICFQDVNFNYPSKPDAPVLRGTTFNAFPGQVVALVGSSGTGKSTCFHLLQRFYDPQQGGITIDGTRLQDYNLKWLRTQIAIVNQEAFLFGGTIAENIRHGKLDATDEQIEQAARDADAYDFIQHLPNKFDAIIGGEGVSLSEAQKQRIAMARALVRNSKILLLEEQLSTLDNQSEYLIHHAIEEARKERTVIVISHRLSTIRKADHIVVIQNGLVVEQGKHRRLIAEKGPYFNLVVSLKKISVANEVIEEIADLASPLKEAKLHRSYGTEANSSRKPEETKVSRKLSIASSLIIGNDVSKDSKASAGEEQKPSATLVELLRLSKPEACYLITGVLASAFVGLNVLVTATLFSDMLTSFVPRIGEDALTITQKSVTSYCVLFLLSGFIFLLVAFVQSSFFTITSEWLTSRLRIAMFQAIIRKDIAWFDKAENNVDNICFRLLSDVGGIHEGLGLRLGLLFQAFSTISSCLFIAFYYEWTLGFVALSFLPFVIIGAVCQSKLSSHYPDLNDHSQILAAETISHIRTVVSLGRENLFLKKYTDALKKIHKASICMYWKRGLLYAFTTCWPMIAYATMLFYGASLVAYGLAFQSVIKVSQSMTNGMQAVGSAVEQSPNLVEAKKAACRILRLVTEDQKKPPVAASRSTFELEDSIDFDRVSFRYPTQPQVEVLKGLSFSVKRGKTVALVGSSGSGKTTCINLLLKFYDPVSGSIYIDQIDSRQFDAKALRSKMGLVSKELNLFNRSIRENIAYGDNSRLVPIDEIIEAAGKVNIHSFVQSLPIGYDTIIDSFNHKLSKSQMQLISLARVLVRNPDILLLDDATWTMDSESEKVVQAGVDAAREGRTCVMIAHRLSTIREADSILVLKNGKVRERGSHQELFAQEGVYYKLCLAQGLALNEN